MQPRAIIADDEGHLAQYLKGRLLSLWPGLEIVGVASNGQQALGMIQEESPDIAFLDIKMPGLTGLQVAEQIDVTRIRVVFVTAFDQFAVDAFEHQAADYLLKPVTDERLSKVVARLRKSFERADEPPDLRALVIRLNQALSIPPVGPSALRWLRVSVGDSVRQVPVDDVMFIRAADKYTILFVDGESTEMLIRLSLSELLAQLDPVMFCQIHRGTIVNLKYVETSRRDALGKTVLKLKNYRQELTVSRHYAHLFKQM